MISLNFRRLLSLSSLAFAVGAFAQSSTSAEPDPAYVQVTNERADKIVAALDLAEADKKLRVRDIIAAQYRDLNVLHTARDAALAQAKTDGAPTAPLIRAESAVKVAHLHFAFIGRLAAELTPAQIDQVKDGLTYGVVPLTFGVYQQMLPEMTAEQHRRIYSWLVEAREHAMDGGSSHEKHGWFGKYKGRINNYLSAAGIDMKQAEHDMSARQQQN